MSDKARIGDTTALRAEIEALKRENNELRGTSAHLFDELLAWYSTRSKIERHLEKVTKLLEETK